MAEQIDQPAGRPQRQEQQFQQRRLAGARRPGEELEGMGWDQEVEVAQDLLPQSVSQSDIFEPNQAQLRSTLGPAGMCAVPAARRSGWRGRKTRSQPRPRWRRRANRAGISMETPIRPPNGT